ncbi:MAG: prepilin-type N-terminal cleavage/methylation domain-containing protein, partial [Enterococcus sp.]|nr:prepilin-type N-terminal cleavage/methylation domain-containing protein [Enterococcus sp.]
MFSKLNALRRRENGFTLAELLVAMLIFGIVVAIAVPLFLNQREANRDNEIKADLLNASLNIEAAKADNGGKFPDSKPENISLNTTSNDKLFYTYPYDRLAYCLQIVSGDKTFFKSSASNEITTTDCTYEYLVPSTKLTGVMDGFKPVLTWKTVASATQYVIYKNNIPVKTVSIPAGSTQKSASYTLTNMEPEEQAIYYIIVKDGNTSSAQSNSVTLKAPVPPPTEPTIKVVSTEAATSTKQQYTIQWAAIRYASGYEVWDVTGTPTRIATLGRYETTYKYTNQRGTANKLAVKAVNEEGSSPNSNTVTVESVWPEAKIFSATSDPNTGKINFVFQEEKDGKLSPDWGSPDHKITLKIVQTDNGNVVFNQSGLNTATYMPNKVFSRVTHTATIVVTTSTGIVLGESAPVTIEFPPPAMPQVVKNFSSDNKGVATLSPNRAIWDEVICDNSTPEYYLTKGTLNSGWITGTNYEYPAAWLVQGAETTVGIIAHCKNGNGTSPNTAKTNQTFTVGLMSPDAPKNFTAVNNGSDIKWDAATCAAGTKAEYRVQQSVKNGAQVENYIDLKTVTYKLPDLFPGLLQTASVQARCVIYVTNTTTVKDASTWSQFGPAYEWETPMPKPDAPVVKLLKKEFTSPTDATYTISWGEVAYAQSFSIYNTKDMDYPLLTVGAGTASTTVTLPRGTTENIVVIAKNKNFSSNNSNIVKLSDVWPTPVILDVQPYSYEGTMYVKWQNGTDAAPTPDWGTPGYKVTLDIQNDVTKEITQFKNIAAREFLTPDEMNRNDYTLQIHVTTATGDVLSSAKVKVGFPPPGPPAPVTNLVANSNGSGAIKHNRLQWNAVNCAASDAEYLITNKDGSGDSGWISATASGTTRYYDIPQNWLRQGFNEAFDVAARCVNLAGISDPSANVSTNFNATILTPAAVTGVKNDGIALVSWNDSTCSSDLTRQYRVVTVKLNGVAQVVNYPTSNSSYTMEKLSPWTDQEVYVQVRCYNPANNITSDWSAKAASNTTAWKTPMPVPVAPVIKLDGSKISSATQQEYTISWAAVEWAEGYEAYIGTERVFETSDGKVTSAKILRDRGTTSQVILRAKNRSGTSPDSNKVSLANTWPTPVILTADGSQDGRISYTWQNGTGTALTPDWGTPGYKVEVIVSKASNMADPIYTASNITATGHTTDVVAPATADRLATKYYTQIKVTTSTGTVLTSAIKAMTFPRPEVPANPTGFNSNNQGVGPLKNDRLIWNATTCPTEGSVPYYQIYKVAPGTETTIQGISTSTNNYVNIPQKYLSEGEETRWRLVTRCQFSNGDYSAWATPYQFHDFTVGVLAPEAPTNVRRDDVTTNTVKWNAVTCGTGTTAQYQVTKSIHNGAASTYSNTTTSTLLDLSGITAGTDQKLTVKARCILTRDTSITSAWSDDSTALSYRSPLPNP